MWFSIKLSIPLIILLYSFILKPQILKFFKNSDWVLILNPLENPYVYAINLNGILLVSSGFFCLKDPDAAFLGLANLSFIKICGF